MESKVDSFRSGTEGWGWGEVIKNEGAECLNVDRCSIPVVFVDLLFPSLFNFWSFVSGMMNLSVLLYSET